jgi:integrase
VLKEADAAGPWMHAAVLLSLGTGLRQGELLRLAWKDIDLDKGVLQVLISKNTRRRSVHIPGAGDRRAQEIEEGRERRQPDACIPDR